MPFATASALKEKSVFKTGYHRDSYAEVGFVTVIKNNLVKVYDANAQRREIREIEFQPVKGKLKGETLRVLLYDNDKVEIPPPMGKWRAWFKATSALFSSN